jgi:hypothetical protein
MEHEHTQHIAAAPDRVFVVLGDISRLPEFVPQMTGAHAGDGDSVVVDARYEGHTQHGEAWFRPDPGRRRVEWGSRSSDYHGWMQVDPRRDSPSGRGTGLRRTARPNWSRAVAFNLASDAGRSSRH